MNKRDIIYVPGRATNAYEDMAPRKRDGDARGPVGKWRPVGKEMKRNVGAVQMGPKGGSFVMTPTGKRYVKV